MPVAVPIEERVFRRQSKIYDPELMNQHVTIVGCGSLGSWLAIGLVKLGLQKFTLYDSDVVEEHNLPNQIFTTNDVGNSKTNRLYNHMYDNDPTYDRNKGTGNLDVNHIQRHWTADDTITEGLVVNAADSIAVRKAVAEAAPKNSVILDLRSSGEVFQVFCIKKADKVQWDFYQQFFFDQANAAGGDCNAQATGYGSILVAGLAVNAFVRYARDEEHPLQIEGSCPEFDFHSIFKRDITVKKSKKK